MSIVQELQNDALDPEVPVSQLLRKAVLIAKKLRLDDAEQWLAFERSGYPVGAEVPEYRFVHISHIEAWNPYVNQWVRALAPEPEIERLTSRQIVNQPLASIEDGVNSNETLCISRPGMKSNHDTDLRFVINSMSVRNILDAVRDSIMDWAIELEKQGIFGEGLSFSEKERETAHQTPVSINFGNVTDSQLQLNSPHGQQNMHVNSNDITALSSFIETFASSVDQTQLAKEVREELAAEIATLRAQIKSPKPKAKLIAEALKSIRTISEGIVGGVLTGAMLPTLVELTSKFGG